MANNSETTNNIKSETSNKIMPGKRQDHEDEHDKTFNSPGSDDKNKITLSNSDFRVDLERQDLERQAVNRATIETIEGEPDQNLSQKSELPAKILAKNLLKSEPQEENEKLKSKTTTLEDKTELLENQKSELNHTLDQTKHKVEKYET